MGVEHHDTANVVVIEGPRYNSVAESNMYITFGGDVVSMTIVPEVPRARTSAVSPSSGVVCAFQVVLAKEACLLYVNVALVTDYDSWKSSGAEATTHEAVEKMFTENCDKVLSIIRGLVPVIAAEDWEEEFKTLRVGSWEVASFRRRSFFSL